VVTEIHNKKQTKIKEADPAHVIAILLSLVITSKLKTSCSCDLDKKK
jgi:hypothetical protein